MNEIILHALLICAISSKEISGAIIQRPMNMATNVSGQAIFNCTINTTDYMTWSYASDCELANTISLTGGNCELYSSNEAHYKIEKTGTSVCNLIVKNATMSLGVCYVCTEGAGGSGKTFLAMLVIVDSNASITSNSSDILPEEDVMISSSVSYRGPSISLQPLPPLPPSFYWTLSSDPTQNVTSYTGSTTNTSASSFIVVIAKLPNVPPHICNLFFNPPAVVPTGCASNAPIYRSSWETESYMISYEPENVQVSGEECLKDPVELICSASGYPTPTCKWLNLTSGIVLSESCTIKIEVEGDYQCIASNTIRNTIYNASSAVVNMIDCDKLFLATNPMCGNMGISDQVCIVIMVIVAFFLLNLLFFVIFMTCYGCSKNGRHTLNDRFSWLKKMLPCLNDEGCKCSVWIFYFVLLSIFAAFVFFPVIMIMASCCKKKTKKTSQANPTQSERNGRGAGGTQLNTFTTTPTYQQPGRMSVTPNPPSPLNTSGHFPQDQLNRPYPHSSNQQRQPESWGNSDHYPQNHRNPRPPPRPSPSPLSTGGIVYAELGVDNHPMSRRPIQPIQDGSNNYADIALA